MATGHDLKVFHTGLLSRARSMTSRIGKGQKYKHNVYLKLKKDAASFQTRLLVFILVEGTISRFVW